MFKKVFFLIILLFIQFGFFPHPVSAVSSCKDIGIDWNPKIFLEGDTQYIMNFTVQNDNTVKTLKANGSYVRLVFYWNLIQGNIYTSPVKVENANFSLTLKDTSKENMIVRGIHSVGLQWSATENGKYEEFCSNITYQVGAVGSCTIDSQSVPTKIPPNSSLTVKFVGIKDTYYQLLLNGVFTVDPIKTDSKGQGKFPLIAIPGSSGETRRLQVVSQGAGGDSVSCEKYTTIDATAPAPAPIPDGPVQPVPAAKDIIQCPKEGEKFDPKKHFDPAKCTKGGGAPCGVDKQKRGPGIITAIGCIHTNPAEFVKDIMTFIIGIGGGLAFLMMLLGAFQMLTSAGNPETLNAGRERLTSAVIGLLFVIFAVLLLQIIGFDILKIPGFSR